MKKLKQAFRLLPVLIVLFCLNPYKVLRAQLLNRQWVVFHDGALSGADHANAIIIDSAGYSFITGQSFQNSLSGSLTTIMYDPDGNEIWIDNYKGVLVNFTNEGEDICSDPFGNIFVTGTTAWNDGDFAILKFNRSGRVWAKPKEPYFTGSGFDFAKEIACDGSGNIYCAASTQSMGGNLQDLYTLKCDNDGNDIWSDIYSSASGDDWTEGLAVSSEGHCFSISNSYGISSGGTYDFHTVHYDSAGVRNWISTYNSPVAQSNDYPVDIICDNNLNSWVCGAADKGQSRDMAVIMQHMDGSRNWDVSYNGTANGNDTAISVSLLPDRSLIVTGRSAEIINGFSRDVITTMRIDSGAVLWTRHFAGDSLNAVPSAMKTDSQGNIYICGYSQSSFNGTNGLLVVYDINGSLIYSDQFDGLAGLNDRFNDLALSLDGSVFVTGQSHSSLVNSNYVTMKYSILPLSGVAEHNAGHELSLFPNPASSGFTLSGLGYRDADLSITDLAGQVILFERIHSPLNKYTVSLPEHKSGIYLVRITNELLSEVRKIVLK